jgi:Iap family predicted aminopeptidase
LELQDALDESNLEVKYYAKDFISHANRLRTQNYTEIYKETVKFLYFNRKAPYEVISSMTKISVDNIKKIIEGEQS